MEMPADSKEQLLQPLKGKVAIITGGSRGIGNGIAWLLAQRGAKVTITYTSEKSATKADELISSIAALDTTAAAIKVKADSTHLETPKRTVDETVKAFGPVIDILVNNAAVEINKPVGQIEPADYDYVHQTNVRGPLLMAQQVLPHMTNGGRIINISSIAARKPYAGYGLYSSSKAALEQLTRVMALELGEKSITVNAVAPGPTDTDMIYSITPSLVEQQKKNTPMEHRMATTGDIAEVVAFLASDAARWLTGQTISASGGLEMY